MLQLASLDVLLRRPGGSASLRRRTFSSSSSSSSSGCRAVSKATEDMPPTNPLGTQNQIWHWRGQQIRYQAMGEREDGPCVLLVHGLFVNADHWRRNMGALADAGFRVFAIDLLGYGYSSKPAACGAEAKAINGENGRDLGAPIADLGTGDGGERPGVTVPLAHPLGSVYNFYTWSEQLRDFVSEVVKPAKRVVLVCNSIGSISGLQAAIDQPESFAGVMIVNPNFRELHVAEQPPFLPPVISAVQAGLRAYGKPLFDALANPTAVKAILKEPYHDPAQVTDELVDVLLSPLLTDGAADVVFDTLSYTSGPLPEQQLQDSRLESVPVWICWGEEDPWTPSQRVRRLGTLPAVKRLVPLPGVGHCPHDEAPQMVNPLIIDFVREVAQG